jgi:hypothetical protein
VPELSEQRRSGGRRARRGEAGQTTLLIVGFAVLLAMLVAVVVDASAAYLQRQGLATLADGAALAGADGGATGSDVYTQGVPEDRLRQQAAAARTAIEEYFRVTGARGDFPGLRYDVAVDGDRISVRVTAPLDLPLTVPGSPDRPTVSAEAAAVITPG